MGWQHVVVKLHDLPVVVLSSKSLAVPAVLGLAFMCVSELQMDVGPNLYWFRSNNRKKYCFEPGPVLDYFHWGDSKRC